MNSLTRKDLLDRMRQKRLDEITSLTTVMEWVENTMHDDEVKIKEQQ